MNNANDKRLFWACLIALCVTAFGFSARSTLLNQWGDEFALNEVEKGQINGVGVWPLAVTIVLFSLFVDKIGYGRSMIFAFAGHMSYVVIVICAPLALAPPGSSPEAVAAGQKTGYWLLYLGNFVFALGNGVVEAVINPVVATMFRNEKTKWLNILHAGWPGGLVLAGLMTIAMGDVDWRYKVAMIVLPALVYGIMMLGCRFPIQERVAAGESYQTMLKQFGVLSAVIVVTLLVRVLGGDVIGISWQMQVAIIVAVVGAFGVYVRALGRPLFVFLLLIMIPLAITEIGTDGWITSLMEPQMEKRELNPAWVLVYTSFIMMVLRFMAGPIVHKLSPLGLLAVSSLVAAIGLLFLSTAAGIAILAAATIYGFGKTFLWPTMLGVVSERFPKGGALTLNAITGVGMLGVGVLGFPFMGLLQENSVRRELQAQSPGIYEKVSVEKEGVFGSYEAVDPTKTDTLSTEESSQLTEIEDSAKQGALATVAIFPAIMFICYVGLIIYFRSQGGYKAEVIAGHEAEDEKFTGGVEGPVE